MSDKKRRDINESSDTAGSKPDRGTDLSESKNNNNTTVSQDRPIPQKPRK